MQRAKAIKTIGVIGAGAWGTALALVAARAGCRVTLYARRAEQAAAMRAQGVNADYLPGIPLPPDLVLTADRAAVLAADAVLYAQPAQHFRAFCQQARRDWRPHLPLVICAKGIELESGALLHEIAAAELPEAPIALLSGPSFARETAQGLPTAVVVAAADPALAARLMAVLSHDAFRPYGSGDIAGVAVAGALKNVLAIACGIVIGRALGENARAAIITRGLAEVARLCLAKGGRMETVMGLAGLGDLVLTCSSLQSRNMSLGHALGCGRTLAAVLEERRSVSEGVTTAQAAAALAKRLGVEMPIAEAVRRVVAEDGDIDHEIRGLLARPLRHEDEIA